MPHLKAPADSHNSDSALNLHEQGVGETSQVGISLASNLATPGKEGPVVVHWAVMKPKEKLE